MRLVSALRRVTEHLEGSVSGAASVDSHAVFTEEYPWISNGVPICLHAKPHCE